MREIKFRAWDKGNNKMFIPYSIEFGENRVLKSATSLVYFKNVELMECTGLKDIHGIMIYEGDILTDHETLRELIMSKTIVDTYEDEGYGLKELEDDLEEYVDNFINEIE